MTNTNESSARLQTVRLQTGTEKRFPRAFRTRNQFALKSITHLTSPWRAAPVHSCPTSKSWKTCTRAHLSTIQQRKRQSHFRKRTTAIIKLTSQPSAFYRISFERLAHYSHGNKLTRLCIGRCTRRRASNKVH